MKGIIDIGSNTIRLVIYENGKKIKEKAVRSYIINDSTDNILSKKGIENLCNSLIFLISDIDNIKIHAIATEAIRSLKNKEEVKKDIFEKTNISIDILSGEDEAECVFLGMMSEIEENSGICVDIGGGSIECIEFENKKITFAKSYPLGCKKIKNKEDLNIIGKREICGKLYMAGGTAKTAQKLYREIKGENIVKADEIEEIIELLKSLPDEKLKKLFPERYDTIITGLIIMQEISSIFGKKEIHIIKSGVREGYYLKNV